MSLGIYAYLTECLTCSNANEELTCFSRPGADGKHAWHYAAALTHIIALEQREALIRLHLSWLARSKHQPAKHREESGAGEQQDQLKHRRDFHARYSFKKIIGFVRWSLKSREEDENKILVKSQGWIKCGLFQRCLIISNVFSQKSGGDPGRDIVKFVCRPISISSGRVGFI